MWQYRQIVYTPSAQGAPTWQSHVGDSGRVQSEHFWIAEICNAPAQREWELLTIVQEGQRFHFVFKKAV